MALFGSKPAGKSIGKSYGSGYEGSNPLGLSNPYAEQQRKYGLMDWAADTLGLRSGFTAWSENMRTQAAEYDASMEQMANAREYESEEAQVARRRAAGLNPDLNGGEQISPGDAGQPAEDPSTPPYAESDFQAIQGFAQNLSGAVSTALNIFNGIQGIAGKNIANKLSSLALGDAIDGRVANIGGSMIQEISPDLARLLSGDGEATDAEAMIGIAGLMHAKNPYRGKMKKMFDESVDRYLQSADFRTLAQKKWQDYADQRKKTATSIADSNYSAITDVLFEIAKENEKLNTDIIRAQKRASLTGAQAEQSEGSYARNYYDNLDGATIAGAETQTAEQTAEQSKIKTILAKHRRKIMDDLEAMAKDDNIAKSVFAKSLLFSLSMADSETAQNGANFAKDAIGAYAKAKAPVTKVFMH